MFAIIIFITFIVTKQLICSDKSRKISTSRFPRFLIIHWRNIMCQSQRFIHLASLSLVINFPPPFMMNTSQVNTILSTILVKHALTIPNLRTLKLYVLSPRLNFYLEFQIFMPTVLSALTNAPRIINFYLPSLTNLKRDFRSTPHEFIPDPIIALTYSKKP